MLCWASNFTVTGRMPAAMSDQQIFSVTQNPLHRQLLWRQSLLNHRIKRDRPTIQALSKRKLRARIDKTIKPKCESFPHQESVGKGKMTDCNGPSGCQDGARFSKTKSRDTID